MVWSKFALAKPNAAALERSPLEPFPFRPSSQFRIQVLIDEPAVQVVHEDWLKDNDIEWVYFVDSVHFVVSGRAEIRYRNPPGWDEEHTIVAEPGDVYFTPRGSWCNWRILSDEPFRHIVIDIPNPGYKFEAQE
jgi:mannose-6-phosphate isomerase-like protein (cupin superfamily)